MGNQNVSIGNKIKEVKEYFINKVVTGDYRFIKSSGYTARIIIDEMWIFEMWVSNSPNNYDFYNTSFFGSKTVSLTMKHLRSRGWIHMKNHLKHENETIKKREKMREFNRLKKELNITCDG